MTLAPHLLYGGDQGGLGLGVETAAITPQQPKGLQTAEPVEKDTGYDFGDVLLNFVFRGYPAALDRLDLQKKDRKLARELNVIETKRRQARSDVNRAKVAVDDGRLEHATQLMGQAYEAFPDGLKYDGIRKGKSGQDMVWFKDSHTGESRAVYPYNEETIRYAIKEADAGLRGDQFMKDQVTRIGQIKAINKKNLDEAVYDPETKKYQYWHINHQGDYVRKEASEKEFPGIKKRYDDTEAQVKKLRRDLLQSQISVSQERLKQKQDPRRDELLELQVEQAKAHLATTLKRLEGGKTIKVGNRDMTRKQIEKEMKALRSVLAPAKGDKPLMLITEMLDADEGALKTELDRLERLAKKASPGVKQAAQRYLELFRAVTGMGEETPQDEADTVGELLKKHAP